MNNLIGVTLRNRYKIFKHLGGGGFGDTYLAYDLDLPGHPLCVVKHLKPKNPSPWLNSNQDSAHLLHGENLRDALTWAEGKSLSNQDYQFISASQQWEFAQAQRKTRRQLYIGRVILAVTIAGVVVAAVAAGVANQQRVMAVSQLNSAVKQREEANQQTGEAQARAKKAQDAVKQAQITLKQAQQTRKQALKEAKIAQEGTKLERTGNIALEQFEKQRQELDALVVAMEAGQRLKALVKDGQPLEKYPATSPILALQTILDNIYERNQLKGHQLRVESASFSPNGQRILTASGDGTAKVWDLNGKLLTEIKYVDKLEKLPFIKSATFSPDGQRILIVYSSIRISIAKIYDLNGKLLNNLNGHQDIINSASFSPDGKYIVTASGDGTAKVWDSKGKLLTDFKHQGSVGSARFSPDGQRILTISSGIVYIWDSKGKLLTDFKHQGSVDSVRFTPDGQRILTISSGIVYIWDSKGKLLTDFKQYKDFIKSASLSLDGKRIVTASSDGRVLIWDSNGKLLFSIVIGFRSIRSASFSDDGQYIITISNNNRASVWDLNGKLIGDFKWRYDFSSVRFSPDGQRIVIITDNSLADKNIAQVWDISRKLLADFKTNDFKTDGVTYGDVIGFSPDGKGIVVSNPSLGGIVRAWNTSGKLIADYQTDAVILTPHRQQYFIAKSSNGGIKVWDLNRKLLAEIEHHGKNKVVEKIDIVAFSPDAKKIVTVGQIPKLWDLNGKLLADLNQGGVSSAAFSPNGEHIVTGSIDGTAKLWDLNGKLLADLKGHRKGYDSWGEPLAIVASFSPDGQRIITASGDRTAKIWDLKGKLLANFKHEDKVNSASFSPDGQRIVTASEDGTVKVWALNGNLLADFEHEGSVYSASFSPDGQRIVTASYGTRVYIQSFSPDGKSIDSESPRITVKVWRVGGLDDLLTRGCDWLQDYFVTHPEARERLRVCRAKG